MIHDGPTFERQWLERLKRKEQQPKEQSMKKSKGNGKGNGKGRKC